MIAMPLIYHITSKQAWEQAQSNGIYDAPSLNEEGFIHCSHEDQLAGVLQRYYSGKKDLLKLVIDTEKLKSRMIYDWSRSLTETFPHIYGPVNLEAVIAVSEIH